MGTTTAMCASFKAELAQALHCFLASVSTNGTTTNASPTITGISSTAGLAVGMAASGTGIAAGSVIASVDSGTQVTLSKNATASATVSITYAADLFKVALIKVTPTGTYGSGSTNYSNITGNSDEVSGTGYTAGGFAWTAAQNISPAVSSATISTTAMMIYNASQRGGTTGRAVSTHDFGGTQSVTAGTLTVLLPTNALGTSILQIS